MVNIKCLYHRNRYKDPFRGYVILWSLFIFVGTMFHRALSVILRSYKWAFMCVMEIICTFPVNVLSMYVWKMSCFTYIRLHGNLLHHICSTSYRFIIFITTCWLFRHILYIPKRTIACKDYETYVSYSLLGGLKVRWKRVILCWQCEYLTNIFDFIYAFKIL